MLPESFLPPFIKNLSILNPFNYNGNISFLFI